MKRKMEQTRMEEKGAKGRKLLNGTWKERRVRRQEGAGWVGREKPGKGWGCALECLCSFEKREERQTVGEAEHPVRTGQAVRADDGGTPFPCMCSRLYQSVGFWSPLLTPLAPTSHSLHFLCH